MFRKKAPQTDTDTDCGIIYFLGSVYAHLQKQTFYLGLNSHKATFVRKKDKMQFEH